MKMEEIGRVIRHIRNKDICIIELTKELSVGEKVVIGGLQEQEIISMETDHKTIMKAMAGDAVGISVKGIPEENSRVFRVR